MNGRAAAAIARFTALRLLRSPRAWLPLAAWTALALVVAGVDRARGGGHAVDDVLLGVWGAIAMPLVAFAIASAATAGAGTRAGLSPLVAFGAAPGRAAALVVATSVIASGVFAALVGGLVVVVAGSGRLGADVFAGVWVSALGAAAYAALFAFAGTFGARGGGRAVALVVDWLVGAGATSLAFLTPRAHVRSLFGGTAPHDLPQRASTAFLLGLALLFALLTVQRVRSR